MLAAGSYAVAADRVFDGDRFHEAAAILVADGRITRVSPISELGGHLAVERLSPGAILAPGFIDVQVNGGGDLLFNDDPSAETAVAIARAHRRFGTTGCLPTLLSDAREKMPLAMAAVGEAAGREPAILGIHLEGPFLSPERAGVHDRAHLRVPDERDFEMLVTPCGGRTLVTLAPEIVPAGFVARLAARGVRVALGHSMADYEQTRSAQAEGMTGFTHLFNAMRQPAARDPGPIGAAMEDSGSWYGLIVDGAHVHPAMLKLALRGAGRPMLVTDAMPPVGGARRGFRLYGDDIDVADGRCVRADGTLAGAALDMATAVRNSVRLLDIPLARALRMASSEPAAFLGLDAMLGRLAPGYRADMVALDSGLRVTTTWVAGQREQWTSPP